MGLIWTFTGIGIWYNDHEYYAQLNSQKYIASNTYKFYASIFSSDIGAQTTNEHDFFKELNRQHIFFDNKQYIVTVLSSIGGKKLWKFKRRKFSFSLCDFSVVQLLYFICLLAYFVSVKRQLKREAEYYKSLPSTSKNL